MLRAIAQLSEEVEELKRQVQSAEQAQQERDDEITSSRPCGGFLGRSAIFQTSRRSLGHR
jgi:hypothetical protein